MGKIKDAVCFDTPQFDFEVFIDHEAGFECDPYDVEAYYAEQMLAYWD